MSLYSRTQTGVGESAQEANHLYRVTERLVYQSAVPLSLSIHRPGVEMRPVTATECQHRKIRPSPLSDKAVLCDKAV